MASRPFIPAANTASVELIYQTGAFFLENIIHVRFSGEPTLTDLQELRAAIQLWDGLSWKALRHTSMLLVRIIVRSLSSESSPYEDHPIIPGVAGTNATGLQPLNVTFCVKFITGYPHRSRRGRIYSPGICLNQLAQAQGVMTSAAANAYVTAFGDLQSSLALMGCELVVVSYRVNHDWRTEALVTSIVEPGYSDLYTDSQRRRLPGRGST